MLNITYLLIVLATISILATLPTATQCDTSYYEKYYSARRFLPQRKALLVQLNFTVSTLNYELEEFESVALIGDIKALGNWRASQAIILNLSKESGKWGRSVSVPVNTTIHYRYFIAATDNEHGNGTIQVRRWEAHRKSRSLDVATVSLNVTDEFGAMAGISGSIIQKGWLNSGRIIQFKLFRRPLQLNDTLIQLNGSQRLRIKLQIVDPEWRVPIMASAKATIDYVLMEYGKSSFRRQPEFGVPYKDDSIIMFQVRVATLESIAYLYQLFLEDLPTNLVRLIGYQHVYSGSLDQTDGSLHLNLLSPVWLNTIGHLNLSYVIIAPLNATNMIVDFQTSLLDFWHEKWSDLEVGHRGLGQSLKEPANLGAPLIENTLSSIMGAANIGADLVAFDVQLTKDFIPILYHDFSVRVCIVSKKPTSPEDLTEVLVKDLTYEQLKDLKTYQIVGSKIVEYPSHNSVEDYEHRLFPSLEEVLTKVNITLGYDVEIKWPQLRQDNTWESEQPMDKNFYVNNILSVVLKYGCGRPIFFSSFDADICTMLRYKQNMYPVMFLGPSKESYYMDPRSSTIYDTINTAQAFDFIGVILNAIFIKAKPTWIQLGTQQNMKVFIWGADLKHRKTIDWFLEQQPTGIIYDRLDLYLPSNRVSLFQIDSVSSDLLRRQCSAQRELYNISDIGDGDNGKDTQLSGNPNML